MRKHIIVFLTAIIILAVHPQKAFATPKIADTSANLNFYQSKTVEDNRVKHLEAYLKNHNSPLQPEAATFVAVADKYNLDYRFLPAVAGVESWFGARIPANSYNGWGWGIYGGKVTYFASWEEAIQTISKEIREKYMEKWGATNVSEIGQIYAADPAWASKVQHFMDEIEEFESETQSNPISISL